MDVGGTVARSLGEQRIDHADDRRVILGLEQILDLGDVLQQPRQVEVAFDFVDHRGGRALLLRVGPGDRRRQLGRVLAHRHHAQRQRACELGQRMGGGRFADPDLDGITRDARDQHLILAGETIGDVAGGRDLAHGSGLISANCEATSDKKRLRQGPQAHLDGLPETGALRLR